MLEFEHILLGYPAYRLHILQVTTTQVVNFAFINEMKYGIRIR